VFRHLPTDVFFPVTFFMKFSAMPRKTGVRSSKETKVHLLLSIVTLVEVLDTSVLQLLGAKLPERLTFPEISLLINHV